MKVGAAGIVGILPFASAVFCENKTVKNIREYQLCWTAICEGDPSISIIRETMTSYLLAFYTDIYHIVIRKGRSLTRLYCLENIGSLPLRIFPFLQILFVELTELF